MSAFIVGTFLVGKFLWVKPKPHVYSLRAISLLYPMELIISSLNNFMIVNVMNGCKYIISCERICMRKTFGPRKFFCECYGLLCTSHLMNVWFMIIKVLFLLTALFNACSQVGINWCIDRTIYISSYWVGTIVLLKRKLST